MYRWGGGGRKVRCGGGGCDMIWHDNDMYNDMI